MGARPADREQSSRARASWLYPLATALLLAPTAFSGAWLGVQTRPGQRALAAALTAGMKPGALVFERAQWGPEPGELWLFGLALHDRAGKPAITARLLGGQLAAASLFGDGLRFVRTKARDFSIALAWDEAGTFNLKDALREPSPAPPEPREGPPPLLQLGEVELDGGGLALDWPRFGLRFADVTATGQVDIGGSEGLRIRAMLDGRESRAVFAAGDRDISFERVGIHGFSWIDRGFSVERLTLRAAPGADVALTGKMGFSRGVAMDMTGEVLLGPNQVGAVLAPWLPDGGMLSGLEATMKDGELRLRAQAMKVPRLLAGDGRVLGLEGPLDITLGPTGALTPRVALATRKMSARAVELPDGLRAEGVVLESLDASVDAGATLALSGLRAKRVKLPAGEVVGVTAQASGKVDLGGGAVSAKLTSAAGEVQIDGEVATRLLARRVDLTADLRLRGLSGALADTLLSALPEARRKTLAPPLAGEIAIAGRLGQGGEGGGLSLTMHVVSGEVSGGGRLNFREGDWVVADRVGAAP